jgi:uncharacterized protein YbbC (DUF1343 family)
MSKIAFGLIFLLTLACQSKKGVNSPLKPAPEIRQEQLKTDTEMSSPGVPDIEIVEVIEPPLLETLMLDPPDMMPIQPLDLPNGLPASNDVQRLFVSIEGRRVGLVVNASSLVGQTHLVDTLKSLGVDIRILFAPEHGFRSDGDAGAHIANERDVKTGLPIISLHGDLKKPTAKHLADVDIVVFDVQDVGVRFYTYISTLHYVIQACAEQNKELIVCDRANPNAHRVDGPVLEPAFKSFVGMHSVPILYGMTIGEYAWMINGEHWASTSSVSLRILEMHQYDRFLPSATELPVRPSPNLPNLHSIAWYPSLCLFEGTVVSVGRGTETQFQVYGCPDCTGDYDFVPMPNFGAAQPLHNGKTCHGYSLVNEVSPENMDLRPIKNMLANYKGAKPFFSSPDFFDKLAGTDQLRRQLLAGAETPDIRASWEPGLAQFRAIRNKYLLYR